MFAELTTPSLLYCEQGIIDPTGAETRQIFSRIFVIAKIFKKLFTPT